MSSSNSDSGSSFGGRKRRKLNKTDSHHKNRRVDRSSGSIQQPHSLSFDPLLYPPGGNTVSDNDDFAFDDMLEEFLPDFLRTRASLQEMEVESDEQGLHLRPLTRSEVSSFLLVPENDDPLPPLLSRKLKLSQEKRHSRVTPKTLVASLETIHPIRPTPLKMEPKPQVMRTFEGIQTTPFENSFLSRLSGTKSFVSESLIAVDWETVTPWMSLMSDIRCHYMLKHPDYNQTDEPLAPITYGPLRAWHLNQVHDFLERVFWMGIDVSDSLDYSPERCTVVACYGRIVVGVAIFSSPQETYITYLAVKAGWDKAQIARTLLFYLIRMNPGKDITLHVSANNSAMLLYNQFGFKAEEFIAGFYEDYLHPTSRGSKNAFRLRLRQ